MTETVGHNAVAAEQLRSYVDRIVALEQQRKQTAEDIREVLKEAESTGYEAHALRRLVKSRLQDDKQREAAKRRAAVLEAYAAALQLEFPL